MTTLKSILFPVSIVKNPANTNSEYSHIVRGIVDGIEMDLNYCSNRYALVPNDMIFPRIEAELQARGVKFSVKYSQVDNVRFYADYILEDESLSIGTGKDKIKPVIKISHSYNGLTKYSITFGYFRVICSNGMTIPVEGQEEKNLNIVGKHTKEILNSFDTMFEKMSNFFDMQKTFKKRFDVLADRMIVNYGERVEAVLEASKLKPSKAQLEVINQTIQSEANTLYNGKVNDWLIYNGINAYIYKAIDNKGNVSKALPEKKTAMDAKVLEVMFN